MAEATGSATSCACAEAFGGATVDGAPDTIVTLLHGTFARHAGWIQADSELAKALSSLRNTAVVPFCWSGANAHADRLSAGDRLRSHLAGLRRRHRDARLFVIAHSHGGNVAMYATKDHATREALTKNGGGIVTLATPFVHVRWRPLAAAIGGVLWSSVAVYLLALFVLVAATVSSEFDWEFWLALAVLAVGAVSALALLVSAVRYRGGEVPARTFLPFVGGVDGREAEFQKLRLPCLGPDELYVIRPTADEASELLVSAQFLSWVFAKYLGLLSWLRTNLWTIAKAVIVALVVGSAAAGLVSQTAEGTVEDVTYVLFVTLVALTFFGIGLAALPALLLAPLAAATFARDGLFWPLFVQMTAEAAPVGEARVLRVDVSLEGGLQHSQIYEDPNVIEAIVAHVSP